MEWYYIYDTNTGAYDHAELADEVPKNSTDVAPEGLISPVFDKQTNTWAGESQAAWLQAKRDEATATPMTPDEDQQIQANFMLQIATLQAAQTQQSQVNANLMLQIAQLQKGGN